MRLRLAAAVVLVLVPPGLAAQATPGGFLEYDNITYFQNPDSTAVNGRNQVILQTELRREATDAIRLFAGIEFRHDQADPARNRVFLDEAYMDLFLGPVDARIGRQVIHWGRADGFNPTDNLAPRDFTDPLDTEDEELGLVAARATYYIGAFWIDAVLAPSFVPSTLPGPTSRWWPALPAAVPNPLPAGPPTLAASYSFLDPVRPTGPGSTQYAVRLAGTVAGWDISLSWFDGYDDLPALHETAVPDPARGTVAITVAPRYHWRRAVGGDLATTLGPVGVRGEAAYYLTEDWNGQDPAIDDPYVHVVAGADYTVRGLPGDRDLFLTAEWSREFQTPDRNTTYSVTDLNHIFRSAVLGRAELHLGAFSTLALDGAYDLAGDGWYARPGLEWSFADGLVLDARLDLPGGSADSYFGRFRDNRRGQVRVRYSF